MAEHDSEGDRKVAPTVALLQALRRKQLGQDAGDLKALERQAREANAANVAAKPKPVRREKTWITIEPHARERMEQRKMTMADVVAIYRWGDQERDRRYPNRTRHRVTERALAHCDGHIRTRMRHFMEDVIIVASPRWPGEPPALITVMPHKSARRR